MRRGEDGDDGENEVDRVGRLVKVAPEHAEVDDQQRHEGGNEPEAAEKDDALVVYVLFSAFTFRDARSREWLFGEDSRAHRGR